MTTAMDCQPDAPKKLSTGSFTNLLFGDAPYMQLDMPPQEVDPSTMVAQV